MTKSNRIDYLDIAKGIGILLVIIGHIPHIGEPVRQYIVSFHMPLFFIISGILIFHTWKAEENTAAFVRRKARSLLLPYAFFSVIYLLIELCRIWIKGTDEWGNLFRQFFQSVCLQGISVLWFFPALFLAETGFVLIRKRSNHVITIIFLPILMLVAFRLTAKAHIFFFAHTEELGLSLLFDVVSMLLRGIFCIGFVGVGYYIGLILEGHRIPRLAEICVSIGALIGLFFVTNTEAVVDLRYMFLGKGSIFLLTSILGSIGVLFLSRFLGHFASCPLYKAGKYFGANSMLIMVTHLEFRVLNISIKLASPICSPLQNNTVFCLLIVAFVCIFEIIIIEIVKRCGPYVLKRVRKIS